jgi:hypothetical protein
MSFNQSVENLSFHKLFCRDAEAIVTTDHPTVFHPIEIAFQLEYGFLLFDGAVFDFQDHLGYAADFEDITHRLQPADVYTIERVLEEYMDTEIHLSNRQFLRIRQLPVDYDHSLQSWLDITPAVESAGTTQPIPYEDRRRPGFLKRLFSR